jgi:hypothetical protein
VRVLCHALADRVQAQVQRVQELQRLEPVLQHPVVLAPAA